MAPFKTRKAVATPPTIGASHDQLSTTKAAPHKLELKKVWGQKVPSKCKSGGKKRRQNSKVTAKSATTQISEKKAMVAESAIKMEKWWRKMPLKQ